MNPTKTELTAYMKSKNGKMAFADFLDVMHTHSSKENLPKELLDAFKCYDTQKRGVIHAKDLRRILIKWGEQLSPKEGKYTLGLFFVGPYNNVFLFFSKIVEQIFREANISSHGYVNYQEFVKIVCAPVPDYY